MRLIQFTLFAIISILASTAYAAPATLVDDTAAGPTNDGSIGAGEYPASTAGINAGFGDVIGSGSTLSVDSDVLGELSWALDSVGPLNDIVVIYIDSSTGGFPSTATFTDTADDGRKAISGTDGTNTSDLTFAPGFEADYAIVIESGFAGLFAIRPTNHVFLKALTVSSGGTNDRELSGMNLSDLGLTNFDSFDYVATLISATAFRSDEFQGVAQTSVPAGNPGVSSVTLSTGDFNTFRPVVVQLSEVDSDTPGTDSQEFVELVTRPTQVDLTGLAIVAFNGFDDESYQAFDLDGLSSGTDGFFVAGSLDVPNVDFVIGSMSAPASTNLIQNGADAVGLYLANDSDFPGGTMATSTNLVDALVYGTGDADATSLLATLTPGEPQLDESSRGNPETDASQRCADGLLTSSNFVVASATPGAANDCPTPCAMNVDCGTCEVCDTTQNFCVPAMQGTSCDLDSSVCTVDTCDGAGNCTFVAILTCPADTTCQVNVCDPTNGCVTQNSNEGGACDDGDACTTGSTCSSGICGGGTNTCQCQVDADCASFEDGDLCNGTLVCDSNNQCVVDTSTVVTCDSTNDTTCMTNQCDASTGACSMQPANEGGSCDDQNECTSTDICESGTCSGKDVADGISCDLDSDACTQDSCQAGTCTAGELIDCTDLDDTCVVGVCNPADGSCGTEEATEGTECDDGRQCTENSVCDSAGSCIGSSVANGTACDRGECIEGASCMEGSCRGGTVICAPDDVGIFDMGSTDMGVDMPREMDMGEADMGISDLGGQPDATMTDMGSSRVKDRAVDEGCGCRTVHTPTRHELPMALALLFVAALVRVRRKRD